MTKSSDESDAALVTRCLRGDDAAWEALVRRYQRLVYTIVRRIGHDEHGAADVFQTVFSRLVTHIHRIDDPTRLQAWIVTTAKREALLQRSRGQRAVSMTYDDDPQGDTAQMDVPDEAPLPDEALADLQQADRVRRALDRLDSRCRDLLLLLFAGDEERPAYNEVSRRMNMPVGSIGPTRVRCLDKLRGLIA
jgi:RNA polymerase sigma factor (sigma-70 family)